MSFDFCTVDYNRVQTEDRHLTWKSVQELRRDQSVNNAKKAFVFNKPKKGETPSIITSRMQIPITGFKFV